MGNEDLILCKKGSLISKSWIVKNVGCISWPSNPRLSIDKKIPRLVVPMILDKLNPGEKMILTVNLTVPKKYDEEKEVHQILLSLNSKEFGSFGEKLVLTYHVDDELFDLKAQMTGDQKISERVKLN